MSKWKTISIILLALLLISVTVFTLTTEKEKIKEQGPEKIYIGHNEQIFDNAYKDIISELTELSELTTNEELKTQLNSILTETKENQVNIENFNRTSAVTSLKDLFISIGQDPNDEIEDTLKSVSNRLELLDDEKTDIEDIFNQETIEKLYFAEEFKNDKFNRQFAASTLLIYYDIIASNGNKDILPIIENYDDLVYLDSRFMTAHIPLDLFVGGSTGVAFEMQYVDGEWKLNPYTAMMSLNLMSILNNANDTTE